MKNMNELLNQIKTDISGKWISIEEATKLAEYIVNSSINVVQQLEKLDNSASDAEVKRCVEALKNHYGL